MSLLENAKDSIIFGLEDYQSENPKRVISCARNLYAGILLLFKHKLVSLAPNDESEALIKVYVRPRFNEKGKVEWVGQGKNTVDLRQLKERMESLGIAVDWNRVEKVQAYRNNVEHYYTKGNADSARSLISDTFLVIRNFLNTHLNTDPMTFLGTELWGEMVKISDVYEAEKKDCIKAIEDLELESETLQEALCSYQCDACGNDLISIRRPERDPFNLKFYCRSCDEEWKFDNIAEAAIRNYCGHDNIAAIKDGGDPAVIACPNCGLDAYVLEEDRCAACSAEYDRECERCGVPIPAEEIDGSGVCSYCSHMMERD